MEKNPFKELETEKEVPLEIKENVMENIESLKLLMEMGDLFSLKYSSIVKSFFITKK